VTSRPSPQAGQSSLGPRPLRCQGMVVIMVICDDVSDDVTDDVTDDDIRTTYSLGRDVPFSR